MECPPIKIAGCKDHIHKRYVFSRKIAVVDLLQEIKRSSSKWIKAIGMNYHNFYWQDGYGMFSVTPYELDSSQV